MPLCFLRASRKVDSLISVSIVLLGVAASSRYILVDSLWLSKVMIQMAYVMVRVCPRLHDGLLDSVLYVW